MSCSVGLRENASIAGRNEERRKRGREAYEREAKRRRMEEEGREEGKIEREGKREM